jgi:hypothetical protein
VGGGGAATVGRAVSAGRGGGSLTTSVTTGGGSVTTDGLAVETDGPAVETDGPAVVTDGPAVVTGGSEPSVPSHAGRFLEGRSFSVVSVFRTSAYGLNCSPSSDSSGSGNHASCSLESLGGMQQPVSLHFLT